MTRVRPLNVKLGWAYRTLVTIFHGPLELLTKRDWRGGERIPVTGGGIVAVNHLSHFDPITFAYFIYDYGRTIRYLGKDSLWKVPVLRSILINAKQIPVLRNTSDAAKAFEKACEAVAGGELVAIYPEGTITKDPDGWPMRGKTGAARIALATGAPLIPMGQWGAQQILPAYTKVPKILPRKTLHIRVGHPIDLEDLRGKPLSTDVLQEATNRLMAAITELVEEIRGEQAPEKRFDPRKAGVHETGNPNAKRRKQ